VGVSAESPGRSSADLRTSAVSASSICTTSGTHSAYAGNGYLLGAAGSRSEKPVAAMCAASMSVLVGDGASARLWIDNWAPVGPLSLSHRCCLRRSPERVGRGVSTMLSLTTVGRETSPVPTTQVLCDYSVSSTYRAFFNGSTSLLGAKELWRIKAPPHVKLFFWLTLHSQLWTAVCRKRHGLQDSDECALCSQELGMRGHMILGCAFARQVWFAMLRPCSLRR